MITITSDITNSVIRGRYPFPLLDKATSWYVEGYWNSNAYKKRFWDGKKHLLKRDKEGDGKFPTGLLDIIERTLKRENFDYEIEDNRPKIEIVPVLPALKGIDIEEWKPGGKREYQASCIAKAIGEQRGVLWLPANAGKTEILIGIVAVLKMKTAFLVHTTDLLTQTKKRFEERLPHWPIGMIGAGVWNPMAVTIAMIQTLNARRKKKEVVKWKESTQCLIIDEAHHTGASTYYSFAMSCPAPFRFGASATALGYNKGRDLMLRAATGPLIAKMDQSDLIEKGISAKPIINMIEINRPFVFERGWQGIERRGIIENSYRNMLICKFALGFYKKSLPTLILVDKIAHGKILKDMLTNELGTNTLHDFIWGDTPQFIRQKVGERFQKGTLPILITSRIFGEGVDIPAISALIIAAGGASKISSIQRIGRGLRQNENMKVEVIDFIDKTHKILEKHSRTRRKVYEAEEAFEVNIIKEVDQVLKGD